MEQQNQATNIYIIKSISQKELSFFLFSEKLLSSALSLGLKKEIWKHEVSRFDF